VSVQKWPFSAERRPPQAFRLRRIKLCLTGNALSIARPCSAKKLRISESDTFGACLIFMDGHCLVDMDRHCLRFWASRGLNNGFCRMEKLSTLLEKIAEKHGCCMLGFADLTGLVPDRLGKFDGGVSFGLPMDPDVMVDIINGPTDAYASLYRTVNTLLDRISVEIASVLEQNGRRVRIIPSSVRSDPERIRGDFPHKTAATRSGLGWVGKNAQLITKKAGPWLRLSTVLTELPLTVGKPIHRTSCGKCDLCVKACPANALKGAKWMPGMPRNQIIDIRACDEYKKTHFQDYNHGHNCGICTAACPVGHSGALFT
jgi:epoxyqueuosine reductase